MLDYPSQRPVTVVLVRTKSQINLDQTGSKLYLRLRHGVRIQFLELFYPVNVCDGVSVPLGLICVLATENWLVG